MPMIRFGLMVGAFLLAAGAAAAGPAEEGRAALAAGKGKEAAPLLQTALDQNPEDLDLRADYARALAWSGRYDEADRAYREVLAKAPGHREATLGLIRLRGYQGRFKEGIALADGGLAAHPEDREIAAERARLSGHLRGSLCTLDKRFTVRCGYGHENYNFTGPGNGTSLSLRDRRFHGWDAAIAASYEHRFALDDVDLGVSASRKIPSLGGWAGFSLGGATRHVLLPVFRGCVDGGRPLGAGFGAEAQVCFRRYDRAKVVSFAPSLTWEGYGLALTGRYGLSSTYYDSGLKSGGLSSFSFRAAWMRACPVIPWVSYARSREGFEAGSVLSAQSFSADHYTAGATVHLPAGFTVEGYGGREARKVYGQKVTRFGLGASYSWGTLK